MKIRLIGLGKMGLNIALNLKDHGHEVLAYAPSEKTRVASRGEEINVVDDIKTLMKREKGERVVVWLLVPNGVVDSVIAEVLPFLNKQDIIIDAGNSNFNTSITRYNYLKGLDIDFIDLGTSGGMSGARNGACLMAGGELEVIKFVEQAFIDVAVKDGYAHVGRPGSGHFVKMVHNGIEYGMMQAIGEGFDFMEHSDFDVDFHQVARLWNHGSIIESSLIGNIESAFSKDPNLDQISGIIDDSGEGKWMIEEALNNKIAIPVITQALFARFKSKDEDKFGEKVVASMRKEFGGHAIYKKK
ncbi:MAG TPA: decarboxylating 6-phosphogluconate dehydrogenase [Bacilli bacterium]|nr:decarboxylating 6-phosphogluconate dehydrogenase [Bacilli bacterium]